MAAALEDMIGSNCEVYVLSVPNTHAGSVRAI